MWIASVSAAALPVPSPGGRANVTQDTWLHQNLPCTTNISWCQVKRLSTVNQTKIPSLTAFQKGDTKRVTGPIRSVVSIPLQLWPRRSVLHATCSALITKFPMSHWGAQGINALINGKAQLTQRSSICQAKLVPSCKQLCFCRWEVLSQVRVGPAAKQTSPARIQSDYRPSTKPETVSSARSEPSETYVHKRLIWEGQYRHTSVLARASSAQKTNYLRTSSRQVLLYIADQI